MHPVKSPQKRNLHMIFTVVLPNVSVSIFEHAFCKSLICITHNPPHQVPDIMPIDSYGYNIQFLIVIIAIIMTHLVPQTIGTVYPLKNTHTHIFQNKWNMCIHPPSKYALSISIPPWCQNLCTSAANEPFLGDQTVWKDQPSNTRKPHKMLNNKIYRYHTVQWRTAQYSTIQYNAMYI